MLSLRTASRTAIRAFSVLSRTAVVRPSISYAARTTGFQVHCRAAGKVNAVRSYSVIENGLSAPVIEYSKMKEIVGNKDGKYVVVDVREPDEYAAGHIPNAINLPYKSSPGALGLHPDEFKLSFGFDKPSTDKTLVFYCLAGVRSTMSEELAETFGYENRLNYLGSFQNWIDNHGEVETSQPEADAKTEESK